MMKRGGQSLLEYVILLAVIISSLLIMQFYVKRGYQGRLKQEADDIGQQYSPGHTTSVVQTLTNTNSETCTGGNCWGVYIPNGVTVTKSSSTNRFIRQEGVDSLVSN